MAGEIEEPFRLGFQTNSIHSGSISFGRFESEALCWERKSSFSHNRYLEEVEKCSRPGSVIEKKAYFEARLRKNGILGQRLYDCQKETECQTSDNDISEKTSYDVENDRMNAENHSAHLDESLDGSIYDGDCKTVTHCESEREVLEKLFPDSQNFLASLENADCILEHLTSDEAHHTKLGDLLPFQIKSGIQLKENLESETANSNTSNISDVTLCLSPEDKATDEKCDASPRDEESSSTEEKIPSGAECIKQRSTPRPSVVQNRRKVSENKPSEKFTNVRFISKAGKETSESAAQNKSPMPKNTTYKPGSKTQAIREIRSGEKQSSGRIIAEYPSTRIQKTSTRVHQSANRIKQAIGTTKPGMKPDSSRFSFKSVEHAQRKKEVDQKMHVKGAETNKIQATTQGTTEAETKKLRKSLNFKATPMPSFYNGTLRASDRKAIPSNDKSQKRALKSSSSGPRVSEISRLNLEGRSRHQAVPKGTASKMTDPPQVSSCHSTVTSDSSPPSPTAETSHTHPLQAGRKSEKQRRLLKNKVPEGITNNRINKGKTMDGTPKTKAGRSSCTTTAFKNTSKGAFR